MCLRGGVKVCLRGGVKGAVVDHENVECMNLFNIFVRVL